jgi:hypothetical protein
MFELGVNLLHFFGSDNTTKTVSILDAIIGFIITCLVILAIILLFR